MFGAVKFVKNVDISKYRYSGYNIGFDRKGAFSYPSGRFGNNVIIFGVDMNCFMHVDNKAKDILIVGEGPTQSLDGAALTTEQCIQIILLYLKQDFV